MPRMTGNRYFAEAVHAHGITHVFFVPTIMNTGPSSPAHPSGVARRSTPRSKSWSCE